ncbi:MAG: HK97 gp10 family phage protein [Catonella sp.]
MGRNGSVDTSELTKLLANIEGMKEAAPEFLRQCADELGQRLLRKVIKRTPVGKKPIFKGEKTIKVKGQSGKTRTFLTKEKADYDMMINKYWSGYSGGQLRRSWRATSTEGTGYNYTIKVENPLDYASYVEHGHRQTPGRFIPALGKTAVVSWVPGRHMLSTSVDEIEASKYKIIGRRVQAFIKERMDV